MRYRIIAKPGGRFTLHLGGLIIHGYPSIAAAMNAVHNPFARKPS